MARRRRTKFPRKRSNGWLIATQVILLVGILVVILFFRDFIADGAGDMLGTFGTDDVQVQEQPNPANAPAATDTPSKSDVNGADSPAGDRSGE
jgi:hypothetical protein